METISLKMIVTAYNDWRENYHITQNGVWNIYSLITSQTQVYFYNQNTDSIFRKCWNDESDIWEYLEGIKQGIAMMNGTTAVEFGVVFKDYDQSIGEDEILSIIHNENYEVAEEEDYF